MPSWRDMRRWARRGTITAALEAIAAAGYGTTPSEAAGRGVIFTLHHVRPSQQLDHDPNGHLSISPEFLDAAIRQMKRIGYRPVHLLDIPDLLAVPDDGSRFFAVTLDDGYRDNARFAAPVFRRHGVPYTIFLTKGFVERTRTIWWETAEVLTREVDAFAFDFGKGMTDVPCRTAAQKKHAFDRLTQFMATLYEDEAVARLDATASEAGIDPMSIVDFEVMTVEEVQALRRDPLCAFGAHTVTHCDLARLPLARLRSEIVRSMDAVENWSGRRPLAFAYPYGSRSAFGPREQRAVLDAGLKLAVTTRPGVLDSESLRTLAALKRISLNGYYQQTRYVRALVSGVPFRLAG